MIHIMSGNKKISEKKYQEALKDFEKAVEKGSDLSDKLEFGKAYITMFCLKRMLNPDNQKVGLNYLDAANAYRDVLIHEGITIPNVSKPILETDLRDLLLKVRPGNS